MHLFVDISSHGFGHLAITAPVLKDLAEICPDLRLTLRSGLSDEILRQRIHLPFAFIPARTDFGYVMIDSTRIDLPASRAAYQAAHADWPSRVTAEARFLDNLQPDLVLTNVSYLPLAAARQVGIPAISLCSLNWADLFAHFFGGESWAPAIHAEMLAAYRAADTFLRVTPGMPMAQLDNVQPIGPIAAVGTPRDLGLNGERAVLVAMGGIAHRLPVENWPRLPGIRWLVPANWQCTHPDAVAVDSLGQSFTNLLSSVDAVITKPGYGMFTEAACNGTPVLYQRREDWPEQGCLIDWLAANANCQQVDADQLISGNFASELEALWQQPALSRPANDGAIAAARSICATANKISLIN